jgi:hypothetical protein
MNFYETSTLEEDWGLQQGDILHPVPFAAFSLTDVEVLSPNADGLRMVDLTQKTDLEVGTRLLASVGMSFGIVLNQSCDLSPRRGKPILIARVVPAAERIGMLKPGHSVSRRIKDIEELANPGKRPSLFYLPGHGGVEPKMDNCVADLLEITSFPPTNLAALSSLIKLRLSPPALQALQERLSYCFGRFGAPNHLYMNEEEWEHKEQQARKKG